MLLPAKSNEVRRNLEDWFEENEIVPDIVAECGDSALLKAFGESGIGIFPAPSAITTQIQQMYHSKNIGTVESVTESYYAISPERKLKHPGVLKITEEAREKMQEELEEVHDQFKDFVSSRRPDMDIEQEMDRPYAYIARASYLDGPIGMAIVASEMTVIPALSQARILSVSK